MTSSSRSGGSSPNSQHSRPKRKASKAAKIQVENILRKRSRSFCGEVAGDKNKCVSDAVNRRGRKRKVPFAEKSIGESLKARKSSDAEEYSNFDEHLDANTSRTDIENLCSWERNAMGWTKKLVVSIERADVALLSAVDDYSEGDSIENLGPEKIMKMQCKVDMERNLEPEKPSQYVADAIENLEPEKTIQGQADAMGGREPAQLPSSDCAGSLQCKIRKLASSPKLTLTSGRSRRDSQEPSAPSRSSQASPSINPTLQSEDPQSSSRRGILAKLRKKEAISEISRHAEHQSQSEPEGVKLVSHKQSRHREKDLHAAKDPEVNYPGGSGDGIADELKCHPERTLTGHPVTSVSCKESSMPNLTTAAVEDPVPKPKEPPSKLPGKPAKPKKDRRKYIWVMSVSYGTGRREKQIAHVAAYTSTDTLKANSIYAMQLEMEKAPVVFEAVYDYRCWIGEDDKFGVLFEAQSEHFSVAIHFEKVQLDKDLRAKERGRRRQDALAKHENFVNLLVSETLEPITQSIQPPCVARHSLDPVWLLVKLEVNSIENVEQDLVVCSSKEMIIYNAVCLMDKLTSRQFRSYGYGLLAPVAASLDVNDSDVMFRMKEKKGKLNSIGFRRFYLDLSLAPQALDQGGSEELVCPDQKGVHPAASEDDIFQTDDGSVIQGCELVSENSVLDSPAFFEHDAYLSFNSL